MTLNLSVEEAKELQRFFFSVGYISYEFFDSIHALSKRVDAFLLQERNSEEGQYRDESIQRD